MLDCICWFEYNFITTCPSCTNMVSILPKLVGKMDIWGAITNDMLCVGLTVVSSEQVMK